MDWKEFFKVFLRNAVITITAATLAIGGFGFLVAGVEGLKNGAAWGLALGLISVPALGGLIFMKYWGDFAGRYSKWHVDNETTGKEN